MKKKGEVFEEVITDLSQTEVTQGHRLKDPQGKLNYTK